MSLTKGWLAECSTEEQPVLQIVGKKILVTTRQGIRKEFLSMILSDGTYSDDMCFVPDKLRDAASLMKENSIIKLQQFKTEWKVKPDLTTSRMLILLEMLNIKEHSEVIGTPKPLLDAEKVRDSLSKKIRACESSGKYVQVDQNSSVSLLSLSEIYTNLIQMVPLLAIHR